MEALMTSDLARAHDWDWFEGRWNVRHRRLTARLQSCQTWEEFAGTCTMWRTLGGLGNVDDNLLHLPGGAYRAMTVRAYDASKGQWAIWWFDGRDPTVLEPPVLGGFSDGVGQFLADDTLNGKPVKVRFLWTRTDTPSPRWEQAFSPDGGATWETNWVMEFTRAT
jgi:hypothetical protein